MALVGVVVRQLKGHQPAVSLVIPESNDSDVDYQIGYLRSEATAHVRRFVSEFVEFRLTNCQWWFTVHNTGTGRNELVEEITGFNDY